MPKVSELEQAIAKIDEDIANLQAMRDYLRGVTLEAEGGAPKRGRPRKKRSQPQDKNNGEEP